MAEESTPNADAPSPDPGRAGLLRRMGIGPRLWIFVGGPILALVALIGLLVWADVRTIDDLRQFESDTEEVVDLVRARLTAQAERHELVRAGGAESLRTRPLPEDLFGDDALELLDSGNAAVNQVLA